MVYLGHRYAARQWLTGSGSTPVAGRHAKIYRIQLRSRFTCGKKDTFCRLSFLVGRNYTIRPSTRINATPGKVGVGRTQRELMAFSLSDRRGWLILPPVTFRTYGAGWIVQADKLQRCAVRIESALGRKVQQISNLANTVELA
jgi:hypothetical protein